MAGDRVRDDGYHSADQMIEASLNKKKEMNEDGFVPNLVQISRVVE